MFIGPASVCGACGTKEYFGQRKNKVFLVEKNKVFLVEKYKYFGLVKGFYLIKLLIVIDCRY